MADPHAPSLSHQLGLAAAAGGGVALLSGIVAGLGVDQQWPIDLRMRAALAARHHPRIRRSLDAVGSAGTFKGYLPAAAILATVLAYKHDSKRASMPIFTIASAALAATMLKHVVRRPRPRTGRTPARSRHSFPSGHTTRATAMAMVGAYLLVRERMVPARVAMPVAVAIALGTGASRMYADAHWTTDVIGGWSLGAAAAAGGALWYEQLRAEAHD